MTEKEKLDAAIAEMREIISSVKNPCEELSEVFYDGIVFIPYLEAVVEAAQAHAASMNDGVVSDAPCKKCGYNGVGYYQPDTHPCVKTQCITEKSFTSHTYGDFFTFFSDCHLVTKNKHGEGGMTLENLYQAFKTRLLNERIE